MDIKKEVDYVPHRLKRAREDDGDEAEEDQ
jgi:hypothetical protein